MAAGLDVLEGADAVRAALSPIRRELLALLREPASASELAARLELSRQRVNYHLRALEDLGLLEVVEERRRRGFVERVLRVRASTLVVDPDVLRPGDAARDADQFAAEHLVGVASALVRDVARMQGAAEREGARLLTFTVEAELSFAAPADVHTFCEGLSEAIRSLAAEHGSTEGRRYRIVAGGHPA